MTTSRVYVLVGGAVHPVDVKPIGRHRFHRCAACDPGSGYWVGDTAKIVHAGQNAAERSATMDPLRWRESS